MELRQPSAQRRGPATLERRYSRSAQNPREQPVGFRNGTPGLVPYAWRARTYPWAVRVLAAAMAAAPPRRKLTEEERKARIRARNQRAYAARRARLRLWKARSPTCATCR